MDKTIEKKLTLEKFTVAKINNQRMVFGGGPSGDGPITIRPTSRNTRPTKAQS